MTATSPSKLSISWRPRCRPRPYPFYERLRAEAPVYRMPGSGFWLVTTYELCREVMRQPDLYASGVSPMALKPSGVPQEVIDLYTNEGWLPRRPARRPIRRDIPGCASSWTGCSLYRRCASSRLRSSGGEVQEGAHRGGDAQAVPHADLGWFEGPAVAADPLAADVGSLHEHVDGCRRARHEAPQPGR